MTQQPEALRLADMIERYNAGVHSQAIVEDYSRAADELRRLHNRVITLTAQHYLDGEAAAKLRRLHDRITTLEAALKQRQWQELTEERIEELYLFWVVDCQDIVGFARAIERTFKEKNDGQ